MFLGLSMQNRRMLAEPRKAYQQPDFGLPWEYGRVHVPIVLDEKIALDEIQLVVMVDAVDQ